MDFPLFVGIFSIFIAAIGVAAMTLRDPIIGEVAGLAALAVLEFDLYAYFIGWPSNRPTSTLWLIGALVLYASIGFALHDRVFQPARRRLRPQFTIELLDHVYTFLHLHPSYGLLAPLDREVWVPLRIRNDGAPGTIARWSLHPIFSPNAGYKMPDGIIIKAEYYFCDYK
jgi:hypothetical protein